MSFSAATRLKTTRCSVAMAQSLALMSAARSDVTIASPYFVPGDAGVAALAAVVRRLRVSPSAP